MNFAENDNHGQESYENVNENVVYDICDTPPSRSEHVISSVIICPRFACKTSLAQGAFHIGFNENISHKAKIELI